MGWKETQMSSVDCKEYKQPGFCKRYGKEAVVISIFSGKVEHKDDSQKTYRFKGYKCNLYDENTFRDPACLDECPLIQKEYL